MTSGEFIRRIVFKLRGGVLHFSAKGTARGNVLISYITLPFLNTTERTLNAHTNRWESVAMVEAFRERGYAVDLIDITNNTFVPKKKYDVFVDNYHHMERLTPLLGENCKKIFHATTAHWKFNNDAEQERFDDLYARKGMQVRLDRSMPPNKAAEICDEITLLGNEFTADTYAFAGKKITHIPISTTHEFESPEHKNFERARKNFVWFGGAGVIHKGLDLVVEAFAQMPEYSLTICGKLDGETDFKKVYEKELQLPNIKIEGFIDPGSDAFKKICDSSIALIYPSCSEGQSGAVVLCMHAGLIPVISFESGVTVEGFGTILKENTVAAIMEALANTASLPTDALRDQASATWEYARTHHTRSVFTKTFSAYVDRLLS